MAISKSSSSVSKKLEPSVKNESSAAAKATAKGAPKPEKAPVKKAASSKAADAKPPAARKRQSPVSGTPALLAPEVRHGMICEAAYYRAEQRGFSGGDPIADWVAAEVEIDQRYSGKP